MTLKSEIMESTFKVLFYLKKGSEKRNGEVTIMARITVDGKVCQFSTRQSILPRNIVFHFAEVGLSNLLYLKQYSFFF